MQTRTCELCPHEATYRGQRDARGGTIYVCGLHSLNADTRLDAEEVPA